MRSQGYHYIGLDVHKKVVAYCIKKSNGEKVDEGKLCSRPEVLHHWASNMNVPWIGGMEATMFSYWIYELLKPYSVELLVGNPMELEAITKSKKKSDRNDASRIADLLRGEDLFPSVYVPPRKYWELRMLMRYRNLLVRESTRFKNRLACCLMEMGVEYDARRLHGKGYYSDLMNELTEIPESVKILLDLSRSEVVTFNAAQKRILRYLSADEEIKTRVEYLMTIPGVGQVLSLTWVCEIAELIRFTAIKDLLSYCGLTPRLNESAGREKREPISKMRNKHLQPVIIEASKLAPRFNTELAAVHASEVERGRNHNKATIAVARKLVRIMYAVDRDQRPYEERQ